MKRSTMYFRMITASIARRKSRMLVALLAVTVGATILAGLVMVYYDMPRQMGEQFLAYGANMIFVPSAESDGMTNEEVQKAIGEIDASVESDIEYCYESATINDAPIIITGCDLAKTYATSPYWQIEGELPSASGHVLVGLEQAEFFSLRVGDTVPIAYLPPDAAAVANGVNLNGEIEGKVFKEFTVAGILDTGGSEEGYFFISEEDMKDLIGAELTYDVAELRVNADAEQLQASVDKIQAAVPGVSPQLVKRITESQTTVLSKLSALVLLVTIITLALIMITVATTMTAVVTERRREIGLRKALGASDGSIMLEFMGEGLLIGFIGGLLGSFLGFGFAYLVSTNVFNSTITFLPALIPITIIVALAVTALACILPVRNATKVDPALVLKGE